MDAALATIGYLLLIGAILAHMFGRITTPTFCPLWIVGMAATCTRAAFNGSTFALWTGLASIAIVAGVWVVEGRKSRRSETHKGTNA
jgi:membrane protein implicated in regulation of membrane protease activity